MFSGEVKAMGIWGPRIPCKFSRSKKGGKTNAEGTLDIETFFVVVDFLNHLEEDVGRNWISDSLRSLPVDTFSSLNDEVKPFIFECSNRFPGSNVEGFESTEIGFCRGGFNGGEELSKPVGYCFDGGGVWDIVIFSAEGFICFENLFVIPPRTGSEGVVNKECSFWRKSAGRGRS